MNASNDEYHAENQPERPRRPPSRPVKWTAAAALTALAVIAGACGNLGGPAAAGSGSNGRSHGSTSGTSSSQVMARAVAYARCMRGHGVADFPDPTATPGGAVGFQIDGGPGRDLSPGNRTFKAADQACRSLSPAGEREPSPSTQKLAAEVKWAHCLRAHGLANFPDPNADGAFDSSRFDDSSAAFQTAGKECQSLEPAGPVAAVPGHGGG